jgi:spermidine/putrescine transport system permease protein
MTPDVDAAATNAGALRRRPGAGAWWLMLPLAIWLALFVAAPLVILLVYSFAQHDELGQVVPRFTVANYARALDWTYLRILLSSLFYAALTTVLCALIGYPVAYYIGRASLRWRNRLLMVVMIPFWTSFLIRTYAWMIILAEQGPMNGLLKVSGVIPHFLPGPIDLMYTPFAVVLGLVYTYLPFMILPIYTSVEKLDGSLIEAAYDLGTRPLSTFRRVILPLTWPGIAAGSMLVFVPSIGMFAVTDLMGGGRVVMVGNVIQNQFQGQGRDQPFGSALGILLMALFMLSFVWRRSARPAREPA